MGGLIKAQVRSVENKLAPNKLVKPFTPKLLYGNPLQYGVSVNWVIQYTNETLKLDTSKKGPNLKNLHVTRLRRNLGPLAWEGVAIGGGCLGDPDSRV